jgi:phage baseplate assembly protein gpV
MSARDPIDTPVWLGQGFFLAEVVSVRDPENRARVQVRLHAFDGVDGQDAPIWARVAAAFAGADRGAFFIPDVGDEVLVGFVQGDGRQPVVMGSLWNGRAAPPETLPGDAVDRWTLTGRAGTRIAIVEESQPTIRLETPGGAVAEITDSGGGKMRIDAGGATVKIEPSGITITTGAKVTVEASTIKMSAGMVTVDAGMSKFSGVVQCDTLISNSVVSASYTPGAGNIW